MRVNVNGSRSIYATTPKFGESPVTFTRNRRGHPPCYQGGFQRNFLFFKNAKDIRNTYEPKARFHVRN
ncbi:MAG: hypothetical protein V3Q69_02250 [Burkholderia sp.]